MTNQPTPKIAAERASKYYMLIQDNSIPAEIRQFAESIYDRYQDLYNIGPVQAGELALQMVRFFVADPLTRSKMVDKGEALRAQREWSKVK